VARSGSALGSEKGSGGALTRAQGLGDPRAAGSSSKAGQGQ